MLDTEKFASTQTHLQFFQLLLTLYGDTPAAGLDEAGMLRPCTLKPRRGAQDLPIVNLTQKLADLDLAVKLEPFLHEENANPVLLANAAALLTLATNDFEAESMKAHLMTGKLLVPLVNYIHHSDSTVQFWCTSLLRNLARIGEGAQRIFDSGGMHKLIEKLQHPSISTGVSASVLANIGFDNQRQRDAIVSAGGVELIVAAIRDQRFSSSFRELIGALGNLCHLGQNTERVANADGIQALISLLFSDNELVIGASGSALENVCNNEAYRMACTPAVPRLVELITTSKLECVQDGALGALLNMAINAEACNIVYKAGALPPATKLLYSPAKDSVVYRAAGLLLNLTWDINIAADALLDKKDSMRIIEILETAVCSPVPRSHNL
jgi:hypothetical protein